MSWVFNPFTGTFDFTGGGGGGVTSVNGDTGPAVVLDATDVGADPTGTAASAITTHLADTTHNHLTSYEYQSVVDQLGRVLEITPTPGTPYVVSNVVEGLGDLDHRYYNQLFILSGAFSGDDSSYIQLSTTRETTGARIRFIDGADSPQLIVFPENELVRTTGTVTTISSWTSPSIGWNYNSTTAQYGFKTSDQTIGDCVEVMFVGNNYWALFQYDFQAWIAGQVPWGKIDTSVAVASDVGAESALGNPASDGYVLASTTAGVRSWVAPGGGAVTQAFSTTFTNEDTSQQITVSNAGISAASIIMGTVEGEEAGILQMQVNVVSKTTGSCDIIVVAPNGATGTYDGYISIM